MGVLSDVDILFELVVIVELHALHPIVVVFEPLQSHYHVPWESLEASSLQSIDLLVALLTEILVSFLQHITLDERIQAFLEVFLVHDRDANVEEVFCSQVAVGARLADNLAGESTSEVMMDRLLLGCPFDGIFKLVHEHIEVLLYVHLLEGVYWLALPVLKGVTVCFRVNIHLLREQQACEKVLPL